MLVQSDPNKWKVHCIQILICYLRKRSSMYLNMFREPKTSWEALTSSFMNLRLKGWYNCFQIVVAVVNYFRRVSAFWIWNSLQNDSGKNAKKFFLFSFILRNFFDGIFDTHRISVIILCKSFLDWFLTKFTRVEVQFMWQITKTVVPNLLELAVFPIF